MTPNASTFGGTALFAGPLTSTPNRSAALMDGNAMAAPTSRLSGIISPPPIRPRTMPGPRCPAAQLHRALQPVAHPARDQHEHAGYWNTQRETWQQRQRGVGQVADAAECHIERRAEPTGVGQLGCGGLGTSTPRLPGHALQHSGAAVGRVPADYAERAVRFQHHGPCLGRVGHPRAA